MKKLVLAACLLASSALAGCSETTDTAGAADLSNVSVENPDDPNGYRFGWKGSDAVTIEVSSDPSFATSEEIGTFEGSTAEWTATGEPKRRYFRLTNADGASVVAAARLLPLEGGRNFRDLGGYKTKDGKTVKWGQVYRSGVMAGLTDGDYEYLSDLGITTVCDFREADERESEPTNWRAGNIEYLTFAPPVDNGTERAMFAPLMDPEADAEDVRAAMIAMYPSIAVAEDEGYTAMFDQLAAGKMPLAFNCSAGKDRAGTAAAVLLSALGVAREDVVADYALSDDYVDYMAEFTSDEAREAVENDPDNPYAFLLKMPPEKLAPLMASEPAYIEATLDAMAEKHGTVLGYIQAEFDVTDEELTAIRTSLLQ